MAGTPAARKSDWVNSETGRPPGGCCRCRVCRSPTEFLSESVAASYPESRKANYCNCRKLCGRLIGIHDRARFEFVQGIEFHRIERGDLVLIIIAIKRATALPYSIANRVEPRRRREEPTQTGSARAWCSKVGFICAYAPYAVHLRLALALHLPLDSVALRTERCHGCYTAARPYSECPALVCASDFVGESVERRLANCCRFAICFMLVWVARVQASVQASGRWKRKF